VELKEIGFLAFVMVGTIAFYVIIRRQGNEELVAVFSAWLIIALIALAVYFAKRFRIG
jgi:nucleoside recognition membrane protein YjiH